MTDPLHNGIFTDGMVCHYTTMRSAIKILKCKSLRFSTLSLLDDPRESKCWEFGFIGAAQEQCLRQHEHVLKRFSGYIKNSSKILCFCGWNNDEMAIDDREEAVPFYREAFYRVGWAKSRMWSQYGDEHTGVCFIFDRVSLQKEMQEKILRYVMV